MSARLSVNLNDATADALRKIAADRGITVTEAIRRAVSVYAYVTSETDKGRTFQLMDEDAGTVTQLRVLG